MPAVTVLYFAHLAERTGTREETVEYPEGETLGQFVQRLEEAHPKLDGALSACRIALNEEFAEKSAILEDAQTVAFIPPVSGG